MKGKLKRFRKLKKEMSPNMADLISGKLSLLDCVFPSLMFPLLMAILAIAWYGRRTKSGAALPPGPRGLPLLGSLPFLDPQLHRYFAELAGTYGPIVSARLGSKLCVVVNSVSLAKEILKDQDAILANHLETGRLRAIRKGGKGLGWANYSSQWRMHRKLAVSEILNSSKLDIFKDLRRGEIRFMVRQVYGKIDAPVNLADLMLVTMLDVITGMLWGGTFREDERRRLAAELRPVVNDVLEVFARFDVFEFFPVLPRFDLLGLVRRTDELATRLHRILDAVIDQRLAMYRSGETGDKDFLQLLLKTTEENEDQKMPMTTSDVKASFTDLIMASVDTSVNTMQWVMTRLLQYPEIMRKAQQEVEQVVGNDHIVEEVHLSKLHYLNAVIKETLRLHPPTPLMLPRTPREPCKVGGYKVPMGSSVFVNMWAIQRDPQVWDNPLEFRPERFLSSTTKWDYSGNDLHYFPFGSGRRICIGVAVADRMLSYTLASLVHSFEWRLPEGTKIDLTETPGMITKKATPLVAVPTPRLTVPELYF
ncbi:flavonoid 3'-monooxygenase CYP75B137-like [Aristolochia californica]|uniref:flavonoid 3'-monooxygenase CYP75B137-like n=1 Tax=Aristolochia californica TaxID=171875 RepID=UPI0035D9150A